MSQPADIPDGLGELFERLAVIMARLRGPDGCPWDLEQTPQTLARHILEEAYETVEAVEEQDWGHLSEELGDLMLQIVFQARIAEEHGRFDLTDVVDGISEKLERRHPHIFGTVEVESAREVSVNWDRIKRDEEGGPAEMEVPSALPAMMAALKVQGKAARAGFDWTSGSEVFGKLEEEVRELRELEGGPRERVEAELGDLLFTVVNLARHLGVDPERALRGTCGEFVERYRMMEEEAGLPGGGFEALPMEEKERLWQRAKKKRKEGEER